LLLQSCPAFVCSTIPVKCPLHARAIDIFGLRFPDTPNEARQNCFSCRLPLFLIRVPEPQSAKPTGSPGG
jgi:hypothetical protein